MSIAAIAIIGRVSPCFTNHPDISCGQSCGRRCQWSQIVHPSLSEVAVTAILPFGNGEKPWKTYEKPMKYIEIPCFWFSKIHLPAMKEINGYQGKLTHNLIMSRSTKHFPLVTKMESYPASGASSSHGYLRVVNHFLSGSYTRPWVCIWIFHDSQLIHSKRWKYTKWWYNMV